MVKIAAAGKVTPAHPRLTLARLQPAASGAGFASSPHETAENSAETAP
jgi:hypothetical protein